MLTTGHTTFSVCGFRGMLVLELISKDIGMSLSFIKGLDVTKHFNLICPERVGHNCFTGFLFECWNFKLL